MIKPLPERGEAHTSSGAKFKAWMDKSGIDHKLCDIRHCQSTGRGITAAQNIGEGETVLQVCCQPSLRPSTTRPQIRRQVPSAATRNNWHWSLCSGATEQGSAQVPDSAVLLAEESELANDMESLGFAKTESDPVYESVPLILNLMIEKIKGKSSKWAGYINFLPAALPGLPFQWEKDMRRILCGTSTLHAETMQPFQHPPAAVWDIFREVVEPWFQNTPGAPPPPATEDGLWKLYCWATSIVAAYSFELGNSRLQCLVPLWDALNHVTGKANVRLAHDSRDGKLQMIATRNIAEGEELVNDYGPLSNGELLRRYGFVEACAMPVAQLERVAVQARVGESIPRATLAHAHWDPPNVHDAAIVPLQDAIKVAVAHAGYGKRGEALQARLDFMHEWGVIPDSQRYTVACDGELQPAGAEAFRILSMSAKSFRAFRACVESWRPPLPVPCASLHALDLCKSFQGLWCGLVVAAVAQRRDLLPPPTLALEVVASAVGLGSAELSSEQAATIVAVGEWVALDSCLARVTGQVLDGASMRMLHLEASADACPRPRGAANGARNDADPSDADVGAPWLLQLSRQFWAEHMQRVYDQRMASDDESE